MQYDIAIIGAGIAGASVAAELAPRAKVLLVEMESQPGYHTTGRSAALYIPSYGPAPIRAFTRASAAFFDDPPAGFASHPLLTDRGVIMVAGQGQTQALEELASELGDETLATRLTPAQAQAHMPLIRADRIAGAMYEQAARDIDVHGLHHGYLKVFRAAGGVTRVSSEITSLQADGTGWQLATRNESFRATAVVNAAGAWAGVIGQLAAAVPIGLMPKRRTAITVAVPAGMQCDAWPAVADVAETYYLKPDVGRLLISPADESPSQPCDAQPEELDVAECVDRIERAFDLQVKRIENKWAGLRSFVSDKCPVIGYDPNVSNFFWLAGQGGYGIQSSPAVARFAASQVLREPAPQDILDQGLVVDDVAVQRLMRIPTMQQI